MPSSPRRTALLIGNGQFDHPGLNELSAPSADVEAMQRVLKDPSIGGFGDVKVQIDATFAEASAAIGNLFDEASSDDTILLYYSGHGLLDDSRHLYLTTRGTPPESPAGKSIAAAEIERLMRASKSRRQVLILDCCYSGAFGAGKGEAELPIGAEIFTTGLGHHVLTASRSVERAYEGEQEIEGINTSLFTHFLVQGLETGEAAREGDEFIYVGDLYEYAYDGVTKHTNKMRPLMWINEGQGTLAIARNPKPFQFPVDLERMLQSENRFEREGAVRILGAQLRSSEPKERAAAARVLETLKETEENIYVERAIKEVLEPSSATIRANRVARQFESLWGIVPVSFVLIIGALAGAIYFAPQLTGANERAGTAEEALGDARHRVKELTRELDELRAELRSVTAERRQVRDRLTRVTAELDDVEAELAKVTGERDDMEAELTNVTSQRNATQTVVETMVVERYHNRRQLRSVAAERNEAQAMLSAAEETIAELDEEMEELRRQVSLYAVRAGLAEDAASKCEGEVVYGTGFQCPFELETRQRGAPFGMIVRVSREVIADQGAPVMLAIPSGSFAMGSPENETDRNADEDQQAVQIEKPFAIGKYEVTFDEYELFAHATGRLLPSDRDWGKGRRPVINVSWDDANAYAEWLTRMTGQTYRLPTEAEWEYAARAGTTGPFSFEGAISPNKANYNARFSYASSETGERSKKTEEVGSFSRHANRWGLNDVHGNVWEWVEDCYRPGDGAPSNATAERSSSCESRVMRGGSWAWGPKYLRSAARSHQVPDRDFDDLGFRLAQDL